MKREGLLEGMLIGAGAMYILDPDRGRKRRAHLRDQAVHVVRQADSGAEVAARDLANRSRGLLAATRGRLRRGAVPDPVLEARVRTALGRLVSHPRTIEVTVDAGSVTLSGPILRDELEGLIRGVSAIRGVKEVCDCLEIHENAGAIPGLQGGGRKPEPRFELLQEHWSPAARLLMGSLGAATLIRGIRRDGFAGGVLLTVGTGILLRSLTNLPTRRLTGIGAGRRAVDIHKTINIDAPVEDVFAFWRNFENLPRFMSHVVSVHDLGEGRSHWTIEGPGGVTIGWDAETTAFEENRLIAWKSIGDAPIRSSGIIRFDQNPDGSTRVEVRLAYNPPAGAIGHAFAKLLGADPRSALNDDMVRLKSLLENERTTASGETITRSKVAPRGIS